MGELPCQVFMTMFVHCKKRNAKSFLAYLSRKNFIISRQEWVHYGAKKAIPWLSVLAPDQPLKSMVSFPVSSERDKKQSFHLLQWQRSQLALYQIRTHLKSTNSS